MYHERQRLQRCLLHVLNNLLQREAWMVQTLNELSDSIQAQRTRWLGNYDANVLAAALAVHGLELRWHDARDTQLDSLDLNLPDSSSSEATGCCQQPGQPDHTEQQPLQLPPSQQHDQAQSQPQQQQQQQPQPQLVGLVLNVAGRGWWAALTHGRHWLAIKPMQGQWWNLDSQLPAPECFDTAAAAAAAGADEQDGCRSTSAQDGGAARLKAFLQQELARGGHLMLVYGTHGAADADAGGGGGGGAAGGGGGAAAAGDAHERSLIHQQL